MFNRWKKPICGIIAGLVVAQLLTGCKKEPAAAGGPRGGGMPAMQVVAIEAKAQPVTESLSLIGTITANEMVEIKPETEGIVQEAESNFKLSTANFERAKQLLKDTLISQQEFDQAAATFDLNRATLELKKRQLKDTRILAPFAGVTGARQVSPGQVITRDAVLTVLVDLDPVKVEVNVPERYLQQLKIGQALEFSVAAFPGQKFKGDVYFVSPQINENLRTALVKARIPNADHKLRGGMFASLDLALQVRESAIVIPEPALMSNGDNFSVFVVDAESKAQLRPVQVGIRLSGRAEILKGLNAGEKVIVEGVQKLGPGSLVKLAPAENSTPYLRN
jgi:membrane fusion protein (multidrug efflux system)